MQLCPICHAEMQRLEVFPDGGTASTSTQLIEYWPTTATGARIPFYCPKCHHEEESYMLPADSAIRA